MITKRRSGGCGSNAMCHLHPFYHHQQHYPPHHLLLFPHFTIESKLRPDFADSAEQDHYCVGFARKFLIFRCIMCKQVYTWWWVWNDVVELLSCCFHWSWSYFGCTKGSDADPKKVISSPSCLLFDGCESRSNYTRNHYYFSTSDRGDEGTSWREPLSSSLYSIFIPLLYFLFLLKNSLAGIIFRSPDRISLFLLKCCGRIRNSKSQLTVSKCQGEICYTKCDTHDDDLLGSRLSSWCFSSVCNTLLHFFRSSLTFLALICPLSAKPNRISSYGMRYTNSNHY